MRFLKDHRGIEMVEAAITTPIAILVMLAIVNLGMVIYAQQAVQAATRHGARMGSVAQTYPACYATSAARSSFSAAGIVQNPSVSVLAPGGSAGSGVTSNAVCPGFVPESIAERRKSPVERWLYREVLARMPFARSLEEASSSYLFAATDPRYESVGGKFIVNGKEIPSSDESFDEEKAQRLWEMSRKWCGLA